MKFQHTVWKKPLTWDSHLEFSPVSFCHWMTWLVSHQGIPCVPHTCIFFRTMLSRRCKLNVYGPWQRDRCAFNSRHNAPLILFTYIYNVHVQLWNIVDLFLVFNLIILYFSEIIFHWIWTNKIIDRIYSY